MFKYCPNIYTAHFDDDVVNEAIQHAKDEFPNECCGAISEGKYIKFKNEADNIEASFEIKDDLWYELYKNGKIDCLVHSHNDFNEASVLDQEQQHSLDIPSMIINLRHKSLMDCIVFGCDEPAPLYGRPFFFGAFDCISVVRDYILQEYDFKITYPPHELDFWMKQKNLFEETSVANKPFYEVEIKDIKKNDILLYNINGSRYINHLAVCISDKGEVLHHIYNTVSGTYPIYFQRKYLSKVMRYKND